jgi:hypothetical protein
VLSRNGPSLFADPVAWLVAAAAAAALAACSGDVLSEPDEVGVIAVSSGCTARTMRAIAGTAGGGLVSPLRFAGAIPGVLAGLVCIRWKLRGPTLTFSMDPVAGIDVAATVAGAWLSRGQARHVLVAAHRIEDGHHMARCVVVRGAPAGRPAAGEPAWPSGGDPGVAEADGPSELRRFLVPAPHAAAAGGREPGRR